MKNIGSGIFYFIILGLQVAALITMIYFWKHRFDVNILYLALAFFGVSMALLGIGAVTRQAANRSNCLTTLLIFINLMVFALYFFGRALTLWAESGSGGK